MNQYEAYKVNTLVNQYRANPDMFNDDQLDELEKLAEQHEINFKRNTSPFSLRRALQQASAGFIEGFTTLDLIPKEPRNTGEAIFRQLGHLVGFAPSIAKAPIFGIGKAIASFTGKEVNKVLGGKITKSVLNGIDFIGDKSIPMIAQRKTQQLFNQGLKKSGADALDYMKRGATARAIADEAVGLAGASAVSSIWKGPDVIIDSFIGGAIAGGAFGGIGNFANVARFHKGSPEQIERANKILRTGLGSLATGLPATLRGEPTEMQLYEYLLGGFFGYNSRPAREVEAGKYLLSRRVLENRDGMIEILDPTRSPRYSKMSKEAQDYLLYDHPVPKESGWLGDKPNSMGYGGTTGQALRYLEYFFPNANHKQRALEVLGQNASENNVRLWYGQKAGDLYKSIQRQRVNPKTKNKDYKPDTAMDFNDPYEPIEISLNKISSDLYPSVKNIFTSKKHLAKKIIEHKDASTKNKEVNIEQFVLSVERSLGRKLKEQENSKLRSWFTSNSMPVQDALYYAVNKRNENDGVVASGSNMKIGNNGVSIGEKYHDLPIDYLTGAKFETLTHYIDKFGNAKPITNSATNYATKGISFDMNASNINGLHRALFDQGKYVFSGVKHKNQLLVAPLRTKVEGAEITKEMIWDSMSKMGYKNMTPELTRAKLKEAYEYGMTQITDPFGGERFTTDPKMYEQWWVSNLLHHSAMHNLLKRGNGINEMHKLLYDGYIRDVGDLNKRMQMFGNKMTPLDPQSFGDLFPSGSLKTLYIKDEQILPFIKAKIPTAKEIKKESFSDGGIFYSQKFVDRALPSLGLPEASMFKPVHIGKTEAGVFATKSSGLRATDSLQKFMDSIGADVIVLGSSFKVKGNHKFTDVTYNPKSNSYEVQGQNINLYNTPIRNIQVSTGVYVNNKKAISGESAPLQMWNQFDFQHKGFQDAFMEWSGNLRKGSAEGIKFQEWVDSKGSKITVEQLQNRLETGKLTLNELPFEFLMKHLVSQKGDPKVGAFLFDKIQKLDLDIDSFKADTKQGYTDYNQLTDNIAQANINKYNTRLTVFKDDHMRMLKKFIISRYANPYVKEAGKAWLKPVTPDQVKALEGSSVKQGHIYLDNNWKEVPVKLEIPRMASTTLANINEGLTLGKLWGWHTRPKTKPKGITKSSIDNALELVVIRTPSDAPSGTRVLRFGGFTNESGTGAITHPKDDYYLGGADKDSDYVKIFQSAPNKLKKIYKSEANGKEKFLKDKEYNEKINKQFEDINMSETEKYYFSGKVNKDSNFKPTTADTLIPKMLSFDPHSRLVVAQRTVSGQKGLGAGLETAIYLQNVMDNVMLNNGKVKLELPSIKKDIQKELIIEAMPENMQEFRDTKSILINKSADASTDPTIKPYVEFRRMLKNKLFKAEVNEINKTTGQVSKTSVRSFADLKNYIEQSDMKSTIRSIHAVKANNNFRFLDYFDQNVWKESGLLKNEGTNWIVHKDLVKSLNLGVGERIGIDTYSPLLVNRLKDRKVLDFLKNTVMKKESNGKKVTLGELGVDNYNVYQTKFRANRPTIFDLESQILNSSVKNLAKDSNSYSVKAVQDMNKNLDILTNDSYAQRLENSYRYFFDSYIDTIKVPIVKSEPTKAKIDLISPELNKVLNKNTSYLLKHIDLVSKKAMVDKHLKIGNRDTGLDYIGKTYGQFSTIELLNKQILALEKYLTAKKSDGSYKKTIPYLFNQTNKVKEISRDRSISKNERQEKIDGQIIADLQQIRDTISKKKIDPQPFVDMYYTMLLSPFTGKSKKMGDVTTGVLEYKREIHGSDAVDPVARERWYKELDDFFNRMHLGWGTGALREKTIQERLSGFESRNDKIDSVLAKVVKPKNNNIKKGTQYVDTLAVTGKDAQQIDQFKRFVNEHPVARENFNEFFTWFTSSFGNQIPRTAKDFRMQDVYAINEFFKRSGDPSDIAFTLKYFHWDPRYVDELLVAKNIGKKFYDYTFTNPKTGEKIDVYKIMGPTGAISNYAKNVKDRGIDIDTVKLKKSNKALLEYINTLKDKDATTRELVDWREGGRVAPLSAEAQKMHTLATDYFIKLGNQYIYAKNAKGERYTNDNGDWKLDTNFKEFYKDTKGSLNRYMRWNKDGSFDFERFYRKVVDINLDRAPIDTIRNTVGVDGLKRYLYELRAFDKLGKKNYNKRILEHRKKNPFLGVGFIDPVEYIPHMNFNKTEMARAEFAKSVDRASKAKYQEVYEQLKGKVSEGKARELAKQAQKRYLQHMENVGNFSAEMFTMKDIADLGEINESVLDKTLSDLGLKTRIGPLEARTANLKGYDKSHAIFNDYIDKVVRGYYSTMAGIHGDRQIRKMKEQLKSREVPQKEKEHFEKLYKINRRKTRRTDDPTQDTVIPMEKRRYKNYNDVWADYVKLHLQTVLGHQTYFPERIIREVNRGIDPLHLKDKRNLFYLMSDQNMVNLYEKMWQSNKFTSVPFVKNIMSRAPLDANARKEYFSRKIHDFGRMEAQYELMTLLANTGTYATNIFSGNMMTGASAGIRNFLNVFSKKKVYDRLLTENGTPVIKTLDGKFVRNRKELSKWMEEQGIIDNFIQHEFEYNEGLKLNLKKAGTSLKNFQRDITRAMKDKKGKREESVGEVVSRYGVKDIMLKYGSFFMRHSEKVNRVNSYMAHALQAMEKFGPQGRELSIRDPFIHEMAMKGVENTQFLYQNSFRPMFMRTAVGKVLTRFKLFAWNSIRTRREFYRQAKLYGFKEGSDEYNRAKDLFLTDMFMMALGGAFMFSIFDTSLAPPYDWIQALADWTYGDKKERDMAFFGSPLGPANLLKPPIARVPEAMGQILSGDWETFSNYTAYTLFPFGRLARQGVQLTDDRIGRGLERSPEILVRFPYNQIQSRIERAKRRSEQSEAIEEMLS